MPQATICVATTLAAVAAVAAVAACRGDPNGAEPSAMTTSSGVPTTYPTPTPAWASSPGQRDKDVLAAVMGPKDTNILLAFGQNLSWGTKGGSSVTLKEMTLPIAPPQPDAFETSKEDVLAVYQPNEKIDCRLSDSTPRPSVPEAESSLPCSLKHAFEEPEVSVTATAHGGKLSGFELFASAKADGPIDPHKGLTDLPVSKVFANAKAALLGQSNKFWPPPESTEFEARRDNARSNRLLLRHTVRPRARLLL